MVGGYRLQRPLGRGGSARVWLGRHLTTGGLAAVKLIEEDKAGAARDLFENERRALLRLRHPNIIPVFDYGADYIATAYIEGADLLHRMRSPVAPADAVEIACTVGSALISAHESGVVHCDVKPGNILLDRSGTPFLADFGISKLLGDDDRDDDLVAGTPAYMAPEQIDGDLTPAADQYALARTLLAMLVGRELPKRSDEALQLLDAELDAWLGEVLRRALAYEPDERFASVRAFVDALRAVELPTSPHRAPLATPRRDAEPFNWVAHPESVDRVGEHITVARYRLSHLVEQGVLTESKLAEFREATGHDDFAWSMYARPERLGPLLEPSSLARIRECIVLSHGLFVTRDVWTDVAVGIARDNGLSLVLTPDVLGFGGSTFSDSAPVKACSPAGLAHTLRDWLALLGLAGIPTVMLGHSFSAGALLCVRDRDLGGEVRRIAVTPALFSRSFFMQAWAFVYAFMAGSLGWLPDAITSRLARFFFRRDQSLQKILVSARDKMAEAACTVGWKRVSRLFWSLSRARPAPAAELQNCILVTTPDDPLVSAEIVEQTVAEAGVPEHQRYRLYYGGHFPQLVDEEHPEWGARNVHELVSVVDSVLDMGNRGSSAENDTSGDVPHSIVAQTTRAVMTPQPRW